MRAGFWWGVTGVALGLSTFAGAQTTSTIGGTIQDKTGSVLTGARVTARHLETGLTRNTATAADGHYVFAAAPVGNYELRAEVAGFRPSVRKGISVTVGEAAAVNFEMEV